MAKQTKEQDVFRLKGTGFYFSPRLLQFITDFLSLSIGFFAFYVIRIKTEWISYVVSPEPSDLVVMNMLLFLFWFVVFYLGGLYKNWYVRSPLDEMGSIIRTTFFGTIIIFFLVFFDSNRSPRMMFLIYFACNSLSACVGRYAIRRFQISLRRRRVIVIPSVIIGTAEKSLELLRQTEKEKSWGLSTEGVLLLNRNEIQKWNELTRGSDGLEGQIKVETVENIEEKLRQLRPNQVLIAVESQDHHQLVDILYTASELNIKVKIIPDMYDVFTGQVKTLQIYGIPLIEITPQLLKPAEAFIKRAIDIVASAVVLVLGSPVWLLTALWVRLDSPGPVLFRQERAGKNGKTFIIYKFRSMYTDCDRDGHKYAVPNDPRVTRSGYFIRKTHLDEVPQFINVLKGDMSIVGPRPELVISVKKFSEAIPYYKRRLIVRPGITGWWQVKYTNTIETIEEIEKRLVDDFYYIENMSLKLDLEILIRTVFVMLRGHGTA